MYKNYDCVYAHPVANYAVTIDTSGDATSSDENVIATGRTLDSRNSESSPMPSQKSVLSKLDQS